MAENREREEEDDMNFLGAAAPSLKRQLRGARAPVPRRPLKHRK